jgi:nitric oxide reductase subunit B
MAGQEIFLGNGLMKYGSIFGHGAYLGPDFTTEYFIARRSRVSTSMAAQIPTQRAAEPYETSRRIAMIMPRVGFQILSPVRMHPHSLPMITCFGLPLRPHRDFQLLRRPCNR